MEEEIAIKNSPYNDEMTPIRTKKDRLATELSLIEAASILFSEKGYENSTTKEIAINAQCNEALIQRYFDGKDGLLLAVLQEGINKQNAMDLQQLPYCKHLIDELMQICQMTRNCMCESSKEIKIALSRLLIKPDFYKTFLQIALSTDYLRALEKRLQHYKDRGEIAQNHNMTVLVDVIASTIFQIGFIKSEVLRLDEHEISIRLGFFCEVLAKGLI